MLVLDDESAILESMRSLLGRWGCEVTAAATVDEARSAARTRTPDLLIVDHRLAEEQTGLDAVSDLRRAVGVEVPALVVTWRHCVGAHQGSPQQRLSAAAQAGAACPAAQRHAAFVTQSSVSPQQSVDNPRRTRIIA